MIHHVSIPVREPERAARALAELVDGYAGPFSGPIPGAWVVHAGDEFGTGIELYPERTALRIEGPSFENPAADAAGFHALISVSVEESVIERIAKREGWLVRRCRRGPPSAPLFDVYEVWIDGRVLLELATREMLPAYLRIAGASA